MTKLSLAIIVLLPQLACTGRSRKSDDDNDTAIRSGIEVPLEDQKFYDGKPSISADGQKVTFISGREKRLHVYKYSVGDKQASRLTKPTEGIKDEFEAVISPDGTLVAFIAANDRGIDVYLKAYDGSGALSRIADNSNGIESRVSFSEDGKLIVFVRRSSAEVGAKIYLAQVSVDGSVSNITALSGPMDDEDFPTFVPTSDASQYKLATLRRSNDSYAQTLWLRTIELADEVIVTSETELASRGVIREAPFSAGPNKIYYSTKTDDEGEFSKARWKPAGSVKTNEEVAVQSVIAAHDVDEDKVEKFGKKTGVAILGISAARIDGGSVAVVTRDVWSCKKDKLSYVTRLKVFDPFDESKVEITPKFNKDGNFTGLATTLCPEKEEKVDGSINAALINAEGVRDSYSIVYVTLYPKNDNEVNLLTYNGESYSVTEISKNTN